MVADLEKRMKKLEKSNQQPVTEEPKVSCAVYHKDGVCPGYPQPVTETKECIQSSDGNWCITHNKNGYPCTPQPEKPKSSEGWEAMGVQGRLGAYLNTMVSDLDIDDRGQYLRDLFADYDKECEQFIHKTIQNDRERLREKIDKMEVPDFDNIHFDDGYEAALQKVLELLD